MEVWQVIGVDTRAKVNIKSEGRQYDGITLYLLGEAPDTSGRYRGKVCREQFVSNERLSAINVSPMPGDTITIYFNRYGSICNIVINDK